MSMVLSRSLNDSRVKVFRVSSDVLHGLCRFLVYDSRPAAWARDLSALCGVGTGHTCKPGRSVYRARYVRNIKGHTMTAPMPQYLNGLRGPLEGAKIEGRGSLGP